MQTQDHLAGLLAKVNADLLRDFSIEGGEAPDQLVARSGAANSAGSNDGPLPPDFLERLKHSVRAFRAGQEPDQFRTLRLACHGCCYPIEPDGYVLVTDAAALARLLELVSTYTASDPMRFRRLFDGLLRAYLGANRQEKWFAEGNARQCSDALRAFLSAKFSDIQTLEPTPDWVLALKAYPEVLSVNPGQRFAVDWLTGSGREFTDISFRLGLSGSSWLASDILRSAVAAAAAMSDNPFAAHIEKLLAAASEARFKSLRDEIYTALLTRYAAMRSPVAHPELRDALVAEWKNPWLARNDSAWRHVPEAARKLVAGWLKLDLIHQFFEVLSEDGRQDRSRFEFWRKYHEAMDDVYFAMGSRCFHSQTPDLVKLRSALDGRLLELVGTESDNNAFIMCMGDVVVVEFSKKGNAAYRYSRGQLVLDSSRRSIGIGELRHDASQRLIHRDTRDEEWQKRFVTALRSSSKIRTSMHTPVPAPKPEISKSASNALPTAKMATLHQISDFARRLSIDIEDHRTKGGSLWLRADDADPDINRQLLAWDFKYRAGRGWWRAS